MTRQVHCAHHSPKNGVYSMWATKVWRRVQLSCRVCRYLRAVRELPPPWRASLSMTYKRERLWLNRPRVGSLLTSTLRKKTSLIIRRSLSNELTISQSNRPSLRALITRWSSAAAVSSWSSNRSIRWWVTWSVHPHKRVVHRRVPANSRR